MELAGRVMMAARVEKWRRLRSLLEWPGNGRAKLSSSRPRHRSSRRRRRFEQLESRNLLAVTLSVDQPVIPEREGVAIVTASISQLNQRDVTVDLALSGSAKSSADYRLSASRLVIPAGELSAAVRVTTIDDSTDEPDESVFVVATGAINDSLPGIQRVLITIVDDDPPPAVLFTANDGNISENGGVATLTAALSSVSGLPVMIDLRFIGAAIPGIDFNSASRIVIPAGSLLRTLSVVAVQDKIDELDEPVTAVVTSVINGTVAGTPQHVTTILDDDPLPSVRLTASATTLAEQDGSVELTAQLSNPSDREVVLDLVYTGTATEGADFRPEPQLRVAPGQLTGLITLDALHDGIVEEPESIVVQVAAVTHARLPRQHPSF